MWPKSLLMVSPEHFDVEYQINPHMVDANGNLNKIDKNLALAQWSQLKNIFAKLKLQVTVLAGASGLPDMVFCANQTLPFIKDRQPAVIMANMFSPKRQPEVPHFRAWAEQQGWRIHQLTSPLNFEGMGDALANYETGAFFGGYGFRTEQSVYEEISTIIGQDIVTLELVDDRFYHLDTCLAILNKNTAAYVPEAFSADALKELEKHFSTLLRIPIAEAQTQFAGNCCTPNGKDVIIQRGATQTVAMLKETGFTVIETDTSEFIKSGGSVFCMKQLLF